MKRLIIFILISTILVACDGPNKPSQQTASVVDTPILVEFSNLEIKEDDTINLSQLADSISYITLPSDILLGEIKYVTPIDDREIIIYANGVVYRYDLINKTYKQLFHSGRGPNEAVCLSRPVLNRAKRNVVVRDNVSQFSKVYDLDGNIVSKHLKQIVDNEGYEVSVYTAAFIGNNNLSTHKRMDHRSGTPYNPYGENLFTVRDVNLDTVVYDYKNPLRDFRFTINTNKLHISEVDGDVFAGEIKDGSWFAIRSIDTIYKTTNFKDIKPKYILKPFIPSLDFKSMLTMLNGNLDKSRINEFVQTEVTLSDRYLIMRYVSAKAGDVCVVYDNVENKVLGSKSLIVNDIDKTVDVNIFEFFCIGSCEQNKLYIPVDAYRIMESEDSSKFKGLTENNNPVIMVVHLKK